MQLTRSVTRSSNCTAIHRGGPENDFTSTGADAKYHTKDKAEKEYFTDQRGLLLQKKRQLPSQPLFKLDN